VDKKEKEKEIVECCYNCGAIFISLITIFWLENYSTHGY
jgi:hypothetical protein